MKEGQINFTFKGACLQKVKCIKMVRAVTGMGLKDAKESVERAERQMETIPYYQNEYHTIEDAIAIINESQGIADTGNFEKYVEDMRLVATAATLAGDYYVAKSIIGFLEEKFT